QVSNMEMYELREKAYNYAKQRRESKEYFDYGDSRDRSNKLASILRTAFQTSSERPREVHSFTETEFARALAKGYQKAFGKEPNLEVLGAGWAQAALESGRPIKLPNFNIGNIKATDKW